MEKSSIILLVIGAVIVFVIGGGAGVFYKTQDLSPQLAKQTIIQSQIDQNTKLLKGLSSKVAFFYARGSVTKIDGRNITLDYSGDTLAVPINSTAQISVLPNAQTSNKIVSGQNVSETQSLLPLVKFEDIKIGDTIAVYLKITPNSTLEGTTVVIYSK